MLKGKTALITGVNRGIGKALAAEFAKNGANIIAHARRETPEFLEGCAALASEYNVTVTPIFFDMTDSEEMKKAVRKILSAKIPVNVLINNAGVGYFGLFQMTSIAKIREIFETNFFAQLELTQLLLKAMIRQKNGCIINMGSSMGLDLPQGSCAYGVSKAAFMAFTKMLASECGPFGIRVNALAATLANTDMKELMGGNRAIEIMTAQSALKRIAEPSDIVNAAVFLASDKASFINGEVIRIDGGRA